MPRMTGGEAIVDSLLRHDVDTVFGLPGAQTYGLFDALAKQSNRIRLIGARHEQGCGYMALGYAKASGRPGVFTVVPGPGMLNASAALITAYAVNAPVMCITGQVPSAFLGQGHGHLHEMPDQLATLRTLVKWAERIDDPTQAPLLLARAWQEMISARPRPVALEMPWDMFTSAVEVTPHDPLPRFPDPTPDPDRIAAAVTLIKAAKTPMIYVGGGAVAAGAEIAALAELLGAPVSSFRAGRGVVDDRHPHATTSAVGGRLWPDTDLVIGIGTRLEAPGWRWGAAPAGQKRIRIDIDPAEIRRGKPDIGIVADARAATAALLAALSTPHLGWMAQVTKTKADVTKAIQKVQPHMAYLDILRSVMPDDSFLVDEVCQSAFTAYFGYPIHRPGGFVTSGWQGTLGAGFPIALGVKVGAPDKKVVSLTGDGGFLFAGSELATAVQYGIGLVTVVFNNSAYGNVLRDQTRLFDGRVAGAKLHNPDFQQYAASFGVKSWRVTAPDNFRPAIEAALDEPGPTLIEVMTDIASEVSPWEFIAAGRA